MSAQTPLSLLKSQLNLEHDLDDALLAHKLAAAELWAGSHMGVPFDVTNAAQVEAVLQLAAYWYEVRESAADLYLRPAPFGVYELLAPYRVQVTGHVPE